MFHYTQPDFAELILEEQAYRVAAHEGRAGHGLYVTTVAPGTMADEKVMSLLFGRGRDPLFVAGVIALRHDAFPWRRYGRQKYIHEAPAGSALDLSLVLVGIGTRRKSTWLWSPGIYA